jgi:hypothetical protein
LLASCGDDPAPSNTPSAGVTAPAQSPPASATPTPGEVTPDATEPPAEPSPTPDVPDYNALFPSHDTEITVPGVNLKFKYPSKLLRVTDSGDAYAEFGVIGRDDVLLRFGTFGGTISDAEDYDLIRRETKTAAENYLAANGYAAKPGYNVLSETDTIVIAAAPESGPEIPCYGVTVAFDGGAAYVQCSAWRVRSGGELTGEVLMNYVVIAAPQSQIEQLRDNAVTYMFTEEQDA